MSLDGIREDMQNIDNTLMAEVKTNLFQQLFVRHCAWTITMPEAGEPGRA